MADTADDVIGGRIAGFHRHELNRVGMVVGAKEKIFSDHFKITQAAVPVGLANRIHVGLAFAIALQGIVMTIEENGSAGQEAGEHTHSFTSVYGDCQEPLPSLAITFESRAEAAKKCCSELNYLLDHHAHDEGLGSSDTAIHDENIPKAVVARGQDGGAFIDFRGIEKIENRQALGSENSIHSFQTEAAFEVEEIGDMSLLETSAFGQFQTCQTAMLHLLGQALTKIVLKRFEFHGFAVGIGSFFTRSRK